MFVCFATQENVMNFKITFSVQKKKVLKQAVIYLRKGGMKFVKKAQ